MNKGDGETEEGLYFTLFPSQTYFSMVSAQHKPGQLWQYRTLQILQKAHIVKLFVQVILSKARLVGSKTVYQLKPYFSIQTLY